VQWNAIGNASDPCKLSLHKLSDINLKDGNEYRIINLGQLSKFIMDISLHGALCDKAHQKAIAGLSPIKLLGVICDRGLASIVRATCIGCWKNFDVCTSPSVTAPNEEKHFEINVMGVWGECARGGGSWGLEEGLANMAMPSMSAKTFTSIESSIGQWWSDILKEEMLEAGQIERQYAIDNNQLDEGVPWISVVVDGGWAKRSHKHSYSSSSGVAVIIGQMTKKLLYLGVRNKNCSTCIKADTKGVEPRKHTCTKNWSKSSQAMEPDIIMSGFADAEKTHGVRYLQMIGDGDSSVMHALHSEGPPWCRKIRKIECANHICKGNNYI
jgi:hypothetical protein